MATDLQPTEDDGQRKFVNGIPQALRRNVCGATQAQFSINNQYSPNYQINSELNTALNFVSPAFGAQNYQMSNGLVETVAAMDIPDYDYECGHKLTSTTQMPFEFVGGGLYVSDPDANLRQIQPPSSQIVNNTDPEVPLKAGGAYWEPYTYKAGIDTYLEDKYVVATSFDLDVCDKDRLVSGINTLGSNAQMFYNVVGGGRNDVANVRNIFVLCTSMVQIFAGATLKIIQQIGVGFTIAPVN